MIKPSLAPTTKNNDQTILPSDTAFDKSLYSINNPGSIWIVVNKARPLNPETFEPSNLVTPEVNLRKSGAEMKLKSSAAKALEEMFVAAKKDGINLMLASAYRSYALQQAVYSSEVRSFGRETADTQSARPGHSEHQTGLAADVAPANGACVIEDCFGDTPEGKWVSANSWKFGYIVRYVLDKEQITGFRAESWHLRYIGAELAGEMKRKSILTLEEFFGLPPAPNYL